MEPWKDTIVVEVPRDHSPEEWEVELYSETPGAMYIIGIEDPAEE